MFDQFRYIGLTASLSMWYMRILVSRMEEERMALKQRRKARTYGFSKGWSTSSVIALLREALWCSVSWGRPLVVIAADIWRCFDRLRHEWLEWAMALE